MREVRRRGREASPGWPAHCFNVRRAAVLTVLLLGLAGSAHAQPNTFSYQGFLKDAGGDPLSGGLTLVARLFDSNGTTKVYEEEHLSVLVSEGIYEVEIGGGAAASGFNWNDLPFDDTYQLELAIDAGEGLKTLQPRTTLLAVPYARYALAVAEGAVDPEDVNTDGASSGDVLGFDGTDVGWTPAPGFSLPVDEMHAASSTALKITQEGNGRAGHFIIENSGSDAEAVYAQSNGQAPALRVRKNGTGPAGVFLGGTVDVETFLGQDRIVMDPEGSAGGASLSMRNGDGLELVKIVAEAEGGEGAVSQILLSSSSSGSLSLSGNGNVFGSAISASKSVVVKNAANQATVQLLGNHQNSGEGRVITDVLEIKGGADFSEQFEVEGAVAPTPGLVVSIDPANPGRLHVSHTAYDTRVAGILSGAGGVRPGLLMGQDGTLADGAHPVALTGRVYARADASAAPIRPGDLLTTAATPGHVMRADDPERARGAIVGKAMTGLDAGTGLVLVLVSLQ